MDGKMFKRKALAWLEDWKRKKNRKPLVIRGARQVGKTSLVKEFGKGFDLFIAFNLENPDDLALFSQEMPVSVLYETMLAVRHQKKIDGTVLVFIDEVQNSSIAIKMLRHFYEELPGIYVIAAGSLLETMLNRQISFPVGRVEYMALRPCTFGEFLGAVGEASLGEYVESVAVPEVLHSRLLSLFNTYTLIGGMPQVVDDYANNHDVESLSDIYQSLLVGYMDDVEKYTDSGSSRNVIRFLIGKGWGHAAERIVFECFGNTKYKSREVGEAFRTLQKAMLLELVYPTVETRLPLSPDLRKRPKLFWLDTGLVNFAAGIQSELFGKEDINNAWRGQVAEHIVGQEILGQTNSFLAQRNFWVREAKNSQAEVDFLYNSSRYGLVPVEVKSGTNAHLRSLQLFMAESSCRMAVRFWAKPYSVDKVVLSNGSRYSLHNVPYYYAGSLEKIVEKGRE